MKMYLKWQMLHLIKLMFTHCTCPLIAFLYHSVLNQSSNSKDDLLTNKNHFKLGIAPNKKTFFDQKYFMPISVHTLMKTPNTPKSNTCFVALP